MVSRLWFNEDSFKRDISGRRRYKLGEVKETTKLQCVSCDSESIAKPYFVGFRKKSVT